MNKTASDKPTLELVKNGPIRATNLTRLFNSRGETIATKRSFILCRCGASSHKPFCDGTHNRIGFTDDKTDERVPDQLDRYQGRDVTILDNRGVCSHAGFCSDWLPAVWRLGVEPWIDPDAASRQDIVRIIRTCPSGALSYIEDGQARTNFHKDAEVQVSRDGPYYVRGSIELKGVEFGNGASPEHYTLCRCGKSRNKPFCDGTHWYAGFHDDEARRALGSLDLIERVHELEIPAQVLLVVLGYVSPQITKAIRRFAHEFIVYDSETFRANFANSRRWNGTRC